MLTDDQIRGLRQGTPEQRVAFFQTLPSDKQDDVLDGDAGRPAGLSVMSGRPNCAAAWNC